MIAALLSIFGIALLAAWMVGVPDVHMVWSSAASQPWSTGGCTFVNVAMRYCVKYIITIAYDFTVLALTVIGVRRLESTRIGEILIDHGVIYFVLTALANLVVTVLTILQLSPIMSTIGAAPASCVSIMAATRLYVSLHEESRGRTAGAITVDQLRSSGSLTKKIASFFRLGGGHTHAYGGAKRNSLVVNTNPNSDSNSNSIGTPSNTTGAGTDSRTFTDSRDLEKGDIISPTKVAFPSGIVIEKCHEVHHDPPIPESPLTSMSKSAVSLTDHCPF